MAKSFREFLDEQKKQPGANQLKEKVNIATAGTTFYLNHIKEKGLGQQYIQSNQISQAAVKFKVPIFIWGEVAWDISGMFSPNDFVEFNKRMVLEHDMRGFTRLDFIDKEGIKEDEMKWCKMPTDEEFAENNFFVVNIGVELE